MRVYELAKELKVTNKELLARLKELGIEVKSHSSSIDEEQAAKVKSELAPPQKEEQAGAEPSPTEAEEAAPSEPTPPLEGGEEEEREEAPSEHELLVVKFPITVRELADKLGKKPNVLMKKLMEMGVFAALNQFLDEETAVILGHEYEYELKAYVTPRTVSEAPSPGAGGVAPEPEVEEEAKLQPRAPVVTLMGHIDHGKTSILDAIRRSKITAQEAGGITQHIGAYRIDTKHGGVVFLDTPGHAAFTTMRARGAHLTDVVILVVAADEGLMPQTLEAIDHAKAAEVPILVAINKIDKTAANPDKVRKQLAEKELLSEELGGETICAEVSATTKKGLDHLLEMILLQAEVMELKANPEGPARGVVVEARLTANRGPVATILVKSGTLKKGDSVVCDAYAGKIKAIFDDTGRTIKEAGPSTPVEVLGLLGVPAAGAALQVVKDDAVARQISEERRSTVQEQGWEDSKKVTLEDFFRQITEEGIRELSLILKGDVQGSVEALSQSLAELGSEEVGASVKIIHSGVGAISESDVVLAAASGAVLIGFQVTAESRIKRLAQAEGVDLRFYQVIYKAVDEVKQALEGLLPPKVEETSLGKARVKETFKIAKLGVIAGSVVEEGKIRKTSSVKVWRDEEVVATDKIISLKRFKESVEEVAAGMECGISLANFHDFQEGDILESYEVKKTPRKL